MRYKTPDYKPDKARAAKKQYRLSSGKLKNMCITEKIRSGQQMNIKALAETLDMPYYRLYNYTRGRTEMAVTLFVRYIEAMGYKVMLVPDEEGRIDYDTDPDIDVPAMRKKDITKSDVFKLLHRWYGDRMNQTLLAKSLGMLPPDVNQLIRRK